MTEQTTDAVMEANAVENTEQTEQAVEKTVIDDTVIAAGSLKRALRKCRDEAGVNIEQAAQEMRLPVHVLRALEEESFSDLPEPPYVRGYLRSYARLNESDPNNLIRRYEILRGANPDDIVSFSPAMQVNRNKPRSTVSSGTLKLAGLALLVLFLGILSMIPAVSQWASETWTSFSSEPQVNRAQQQAATARTTPTETLSGEIDRNATTDDPTTSATENSDASRNDKPAGNEQLALNTEQSGSTTASDNASGETSAATNPSSSTDTAADNNTAVETSQNQNTAEAEGTENADATTATDNQPAATEGTTEAPATAGSTDATATTETTTAETDATQPEQNSATEEPAADSPTDATTEDSATETAATTTAAATDTDATTEADTASAAAEATEAATNSAETTAEQPAQSGNNNFTQPHDGNVSIRLDFTQDCWMSIKDEKGKAIFSALNTAGTRKELKARTPLKFKVGNAAGVQIYLNGQLIDPRPYTRGNVATFEVN